MNFRSERVSSLVRDELAKIIVRELEFPGALVTITQVEADKKLDHAWVDVSVLPAAKEQSALGTLNKASGYLQHLLLKKINIKPMPRIEFRIDHGPANAAKVEKALLDE